MRQPSLSTTLPVDPSHASSSTAPFRDYPQQSLASVEYPGPVSHPSALLKVIPQEDLNECFNAPPSESKTLEMSYRREDRYGVPVRGTRVASQKLLLKIVKRRRKRMDGMEVDGQEGRRQGKGKERDLSPVDGVFTAEIMGPVTQTVRFRAMADWHYTPNPEGRVSQLVSSLRDLNYDAILDYSVPPLDETFTEPVTPPEDGSTLDNELAFRSLLDLQPMPIFSDRRLPQVYNFKNHPQAVVEEVEDERTGQIKKRYVNKSRAVGFAPQRIGHGHTLGEVPTEPVKGVKDRMDKLDQRILAKLRQLSIERPVWQRHALLAHFDETEKRIIITNRMYLPALFYGFGAGPFWKSLVRFGYDPCVHPEARFYQRLYFYVHVNREGRKNPVADSVSPAPEPDPDDPGEFTKTRSWWETVQEERVADGKRPPLDRSRDYIFDGKILHRDRPDFQLCDITDPLIAKFINDPANASETCDPKDGWYIPAVLDLIKTITRLKYIHVRETGEPAPNSLCYGAIEDYERGLLEGKEGDEDGDSHMDM